LHYAYHLTRLGSRAAEAVARSSVANEDTTTEELQENTVEGEEEEDGPTGSSGGSAGNPAGG
jgi:hypothetical protein